MTQELTQRVCIIDDVCVVTDNDPESNEVSLLIDLVDDDTNEQVTVKFSDYDFLEFVNSLQISFLHAVHNCTNHS